MGQGGCGQAWIVLRVRAQVVSAGWGHGGYK